jgi:external thioesterase TEII
MVKPQLFMLHFAGGNCHSFQFMAPFLKNFDTVCLELPGRGRRINEELLSDFDSAATDLFNELIAKLKPGPFMLYGHSMGAYLALRVCNMLEKKGRMPVHLMVSGNAGPGKYAERNIYRLPHDEFFIELKKLGGVPDEFTESAELLEFFEPILRADFEIAEENGLENEPAVAAPLTALMGTEEEKTDEISNWGRFTRSAFNHELLEGGHFFIHHHAEKIAAIFRHCMDRLGNRPVVS